MATTVYSSTDAGAPVLDKAQGTMINVLKGCLVNGYGTKPAAGWSVTLDDPVNFMTVFRNATTTNAKGHTGSGYYWRVKDDGAPTTNDTTGSYMGAAAITGAKAFTDINTPVIPFPRTITGGDVHSTTAYGSLSVWISLNRNVTFLNSTNQYATATSNPASSFPWMVVADEFTAYIVTAPFGAHGSSILSEGALQFLVIGDLSPRGNGPYAVTGGNFTTQFPYNASLDSTSAVYIAESIGGGGYSTPCRVYATNDPFGVVGAMSEPYPSPITNGAMLARLYVAEDTSNVRYTGNKPGDSQNIRVGRYRGLYSCIHSLGPAASDLANSGDTIDDGTRQYLLLKSGVANASDQSPGFRHLAFDITGDW